MNERTISKHIGIVGGSAEGAALCYRTICVEAETAMGEHMHPEVSMHTYALGEYMKHLDQDDWAAVGEMMGRSASKLAEIGAQFAICPDNTFHQAFAVATRNSPIPWLHIARCVGEQARSEGFGKLGVTGTAYLMTGPVYPEQLSALGIRMEIPEPEQRDRMNRIIFDELVKGVFSEASQRYFNDVFESLIERGCDAVVMGCTEIPLLMDGVETAMPTLDSTRILARAAIRHALG